MVVGGGGGGATPGSDPVDIARMIDIVKKKKEEALALRQQKEHESIFEAAAEMNMYWLIGSIVIAAALMTAALESLSGSQVNTVQ